MLPPPLENLIARRPLLFAAAGALAILAGFGFYRIDAAAHFCAGFGGTLLLLALVGWRREELGWTAVLVTLAAIAIGVVAEFTVFSDMVPDAVDVAHQSMGAVLAAAVMLGRPARFKPLAPTALLILGIGFVFAHFA